VTAPRVERTYDTDLVRSVFSSSRIKQRISDVQVEEFDPASQEDLYYLACYRDDVVIGIVLFHPFNSLACCQGHVNYLKQYWGTDLHEYTKAAIKWMFENTDFIKIVALIPDFYSVVLNHALMAGMRIEGYIENSVISNGKVDNMTLVGIDKCL
jgi:RimJ/RimL family protein N-acetyltransferase